ncbi:MAG: DNA-3-methyladenine glycosylase family protein [Motilibacteraceae bacterium]
MTVPESSRTWRPGRPVDAGATLGVLRRGGGDPAHQGTADGAVWRTTRTPDGPATLRLVVRRGEGTVQAQAWGPGAAWVLEGVPALLGAEDDLLGFAARHQVVADALVANPGWRVPRTRRVMEALVPAILEQKVTGAEARRAWRWLLLRHGEPAPGPAPEGMRVVPTPEQWAHVPSWDWHRAGVEGVRSRTIVLAARVAARLEETVDLPVVDALRRLRAVPGIGRWTAAEVVQRAHGHADEVSYGDFHVAAWIGWALTGSPVDDDGMMALLEPYAGHRYRVQRLVELSGVRKPRFAPRMSVKDHRAI